MNTYRVTRTDRAVVQEPCSHLHTCAVEIVAERSAETTPSMTWTVDDVLREHESASLVTGPVDVTVPIDVGVTVCKTCGERVLQVLPEEVERSLSDEPHYV